MKKQTIIQLLPVIIGFISLFSGMLVILGWVKEIDVLKTFGLGFVPMKANLGLNFSLIGLILIINDYSFKFSKILVRGLSIIVILVGLTTMLESILSIAPGIDKMLIPKNVRISGNILEWRMAFNAALGTTMVAVMSFLISFGRFKLSFLLQWSLFLVVSMGTVGIVGFTFGLASFPGVTGYGRMAVSAAILLILTGSATFILLKKNGKFRIKIEELTIGVLTFVVSILIFISLLNISAIQTKAEIQRRVELTTTITSYMNSIRKKALDVETGSRGYLLGNKEAYFEPIINAKSEIPIEINELKVLVEDNKQQLEYLNVLSRLIDKRIDFAEEIYQTYEIDGFDAAIKGFNSQSGRILTDSIRQVIADMQIEENSVIIEKNKSEFEVDRKRNILMNVNDGVQLILIVMILYFLVKSIQNKKNAESKILQLNNELEQKVIKRTKELSKSEERYRNTLENMMEGCQIIDFDFKYVYLNKEAVKQSGLGKSDLIGCSMIEKYQGIEHSEMFKNLEKCMKERSPIAMENQFDYGNGERAWFELKMEPVSEGVFILSTDITEKINAKLALQKSEGLHKLLFDYNPLPMWVYDLETLRFLKVNSTACGKYGYTNEEFEKMTLKDILMVDELHELNINTSTYHEHRIQRSGIWKHKLKNGNFIYVEINSHSIEYDDKNARMVTINDVTEKVEAESALVESEKRYKNLFTYSPYAILVDLNGKVIFTNKASLKLFGAKKEEDLVGKSPYELVHPDYHSKTREHLQFIYDNEIEVDLVEQKIIRLDGNEVDVEVVAAPFLIGSQTAIHIILNDITERKKQENKIRKLNQSLERKVALRTSQLEAANKAISEFLANMSHEIRTPMNAVLGYADILSSEITDKVQKEYLESIKSSGRGLLTIINDVLDLSKIQAGKMELVFDYINTVEFFSEFGKVFSLKLKQKGINWILDIASSTPPNLYLDEARLRQILLNLIGNAAKFTEKGYVRLYVYSENHKVLSYTQDKTEEFIDLVIEVEDTGIGISNEFQKRIFDEFVQEDRNRNQGTGLGLTITKRLINMMGGDISVKSALNKGTVFKIQMPDIAFSRLNKEDVDLNQLPQSDVMFEESTILIVDDVEINRKYLKDALKDTKIIIFEASGGEQGLDILTKLKPDLIICDIKMPIMDGFEFLDAVKSKKDMANVPVIAYSASVMKEQKKRIYNSGFAGLIVKPVLVRELYAHLCKYLPYVLTEQQNDSTNTSLEVENMKNEIVNMPELLIKLELSFKKWEEFENRQPLSEVNEFGVNLKMIGELHHAKVIQYYGNEIIGAAKSFNIDKLLRLLKQFPEIVDSIRTVI